MFERELATCERLLPELMQQKGRFVVIKGDEVAGAWDTWRDALSTGYDRFGLKGVFHH